MKLVWTDYMKHCDLARKLHITNFLGISDTKINMI